jgi:hypothetical protein
MAAAVKSTKNVGGFKFRSKADVGGKSTTEVPLKPPSPASPPRAPEPRSSGTKRRASGGGSIVDDKLPKDVVVKFSASSVDGITGPAFALAAALAAVHDYTAAIQRGQPAYFSTAAGSVAEAFERAAAAAVSDTTSALLQNPKNAANSKRLATLKLQMARCVHACVHVPGDILALF